MPVTARLSRKFYERLGDDVVNELVDWFNAVDATYRADLDRLNEVNFQRFDAKVEQRFAEADAKLEQRLAAFETEFGRRLAAFETKVEHRFAEADAKVEHRFAAADAKLEQWFAAADTKRESEITALRDEFGHVKFGLLRWMFTFWATTMLAILMLHLG